MANFSLKNLNEIDNEADVEALVVEPLLEFLGYTQDCVKRKDSIQKLVISKGSKKENYKPDYVLFHEKKPVVVIDAKAPNVILEDFIYQVSGYALSLNQKFSEGDNPCQITVLTNGKYLKVFGWDDANAVYDTPINQINYEHLKSILGKQKIAKSLKKLNKDNSLSLDLGLPPRRQPTKDEISKVFFEINNYIWKKEGMKPTDAFWEFVKLFSLKMDNDKKISKNPNITADEVSFSSNFIKKQLAFFPKINPIKEVFNKFREELEIDITREKKKRLFAKGEELTLNLDTIRYVVEKLEKYDLSKIDEDLNGRMFEVFLRAAVRGRELGQYFTPRDAIKFMVKLAEPNEHTKVLDACCGSGGFLIESLAYMMHNIPQNLPEKKREEILKKIRENLIVGADKEEKVARLARINMYVHKDGSSSIFRLQDALDKDLKIDKTLSIEEQDQYKEAKKVLKDGEFQIVLTNPPFASNYTLKEKKEDGQKKDSEDKKMLASYTVVGSKNSVNSNILFVERYYDLLEVGGKLITVIDDSLLNAKNQKSYREWMMERFHVKAVISLPFNAFINASTTIKTSILYLEKKEYQSASDGKVFMAICNNIGHNDSGKDTPERNNLNLVYDQWLEFKKGKDLSDQIVENQDKYEMLTCPLQIFTIPYSSLLPERFDAFFYSPELKKLHNKIDSLDKKKFSVELGKKFDLQKAVGDKYAQDNSNKIYNYIEVGSCNKRGDVVSSQSDLLANLPTRARMMVGKFDVITPKNISSLYSTCIINSNTAGSLVSTGFFVFTNLSERDAYLLWSSLRSDLVQRQFYYLSATAVQPELAKEYLENFVKIPIPIGAYANKIYEDVRRCNELRNDLDNKLSEVSNDLMLK